MELTEEKLPQSTTSVKLSVREKVSYGLGDTASNLVFSMITMYLMFYYTDVAGINIAAVGTLMLVARVIDAFDSPIFGILIDKTNTKWGKSRPWFLWLCVPFGIFAVLAFSVPDTGDSSKLIYAYVTYIVLGILYAGINLPLGSLLPSLTTDPQERTVANTCRMMGGQFGALIVAFGGLFLVQLLGGGNAQRGFTLTMVLFASAAILMFLTTFANTRERVNINNGAAVPFKQSIKALVPNKPWWIITALMFITWTCTSAKMANTVYFLKYNLGNEQIAGIVNGLGTIGILAGLFMVPMISQKMKTRDIVILGSGIAIFGQLILYISSLYSSIPIVIIGTIIGSIGSGLPAGIMGVMLSDTIDYGEVKFGVRAQGLLSSAVAFGVKFGMGIGAAISSLILGMAGYTANQAQAGGALRAIEMNFVWLPAIGFILIILIVFFYKLDDERDAIRMQIEENRQQEGLKDIE
ncbi:MULTISPECIES: MFS transporter [unclassified Listeria]|uniref:MFS transporter n=1 Tax=unclassified Listeria TaxID=2642072 RepID=UPI000B590D20|nr:MULTISPECIES: MFS transporter [unclassified Listeria]